ncbi:MAG: hypothetical protein RBU30_05750 [Polyangia bacterium]|jgi:hypothetical protein|nr:hypothetical protein [Polyangia bacterium]
MEPSLEVGLEVPSLPEILGGIVSVNASVKERGSRRGAPVNQRYSRKLKGKRVLGSTRRERSHPAEDRERATELVNQTRSGKKSKLIGINYFVRKFSSAGSTGAGSTDDACETPCVVPVRSLSGSMQRSSAIM